MLRGVDGFLQGIAEEDAQYADQRFADLVIRALGDDRIVMTYTLSAQPRDGAPFTLRGVELLTVREGRIARKDVFMKQSRPCAGPPVA